MEIEKLIERLKCPQIHSCPMDGEYPSCKSCQKDVQKEAATALYASQIELKAMRGAANSYKTENAQLRDALEEIEGEKDAAIADLKKWSICATCANYNPCGRASHCKIKEAYLHGGNWAGCSKWKWRGQKKEEA